MGLFDEVVGDFLKGDEGKYQSILNRVEEQGFFLVLLFFLFFVCFVVFLFVLSLIVGLLLCLFV